MARITGATDAVARLRRDRQEYLREKMQGAEYLNQLQKIDEELDRGVDRERLEILKVRIELNLARLKKLLPDEKYMEIEANFEGNIGVRKVIVEGVKTQNA